VLYVVQGSFCNDNLHRAVFGSDSLGILCEWINALSDSFRRVYSLTASKMQVAASDQSGWKEEKIALREASMRVTLNYSRDAV
jgi:hypothetical protein